MQSTCPQPNEFPLTKEQIALDLLDQMRAEDLLHYAVVADEVRGEQYVVGVTGKVALFVEPPA